MMKKSIKFPEVKILKDKRITVISLSLILALLFRRIFFIPLLMIISFGISYIKKAFHLRQIGIEFVMLTSIIAGRAYNYKLGLIVGLVLIITHLVLSGHFGLYIFWVIPSYTLAAMLAGIFQNIPIVTYGIMSAIIVNAVCILMTFATNPGYVIKSLPNFISNAMINILLFLSLGDFLITMLT